MSTCRSAADSVPRDLVLCDVAGTAILDQPFMRCQGWQHPGESGLAGSDPHSVVAVEASRAWCANILRAEGGVRISKWLKVLAPVPLTATARQYRSGLRRTPLTPEADACS